MKARLASIAVAGAVAVAAASPARAYRTLADDPSFGTSVPPTWGASAPTIELWTDLPPPTGAQAYDALTRAAEIWSGAECSSWTPGLSPTATSRPAPGDGRNTVGLITSGWSDLGLHPDAGATTDVQLVREDGSTWRVVEADVYVDWTRPWSFDDASPDGTPSVALVLAHELGHVAGLAHPCSIDGAPACDATARDSILYPAYASRPIALSADDVAGICALYPARDCAGGCPAGTHCDSEACVPGVCPGDCDAGCSGMPCGSCETDADCDPALRCAPSTLTCVVPGARGAACLSGADCASDLCVAGATTLPFCTITCTADAECGGGGERCRSAEGMHVCAPAAASQGCTVAHGRSQSTAALIWLAALAVAIRARRRERR